MKKRFLNIIYGVEALNSRLNGSAKDVEKPTQFDNITFAKKINGKAYVSSVCEKKNIKRYMEDIGEDVSTYKKEGKKVIIEAHPAKYINEDVFGLMRADKEQITEEEYDKLDDDMKKLYDKSKNGFTRNVTKKRKARFLMNGMIGVNRGRVNSEWNVCCTEGTGTDNQPYVMETYSDMLVGLANFNITDTSKFITSKNEKEFRDYSEDEAEALDIPSELSKEQKFNRIKIALEGLEYLSISSNQANYLTDTMPKIAIMAEYDWGNNVFQGLINKDGINIDGLLEVIDSFDKHRKSDIWIGVSSRIMNENFRGLKEKLKESLSDYDFIKIGTVKNAFDGYLNYLKESL